MQLKPSIMFVDDDSNAIDSYRRLLRPFVLEWDILYRTDSLKACNEIRHNPPDVLVTDVTMPFMSGLELLTSVKSNMETQNISVIVVTGRNERDLKRRALDAGATDLMIKPVEFEELLARLRGSLRLKACYDELT
jgi:PleD family two-component response regulator